MNGLWSGKAGKTADAASSSAGTAAPRPLDRIYRQHWDEICRYVRRSFGAGPPDPEDVAQAAFARFAALDAEVEVANPRAFLFRTAHNIAIDARRSAARRGVVLADPAVTEPDLVDASPEQALVLKDELVRLDGAIASLKPKQRVALLLHRLDGLSYAEIGRRLQVSPSGARKLVEGGFEACTRRMKKGGRHDAL